MGGFLKISGKIIKRARRNLKEKKKVKRACEGGQRRLNKLSDPLFIQENKQYCDDLKKSGGFYVGMYPQLRGFCHILPYNYNPPAIDLSRSRLVTLVCLSQLAIAFYNINKDTCFGDVIVLMSTRSHFTYHITFQASPPHGEPVTFKTSIYMSLPLPCRKVLIKFVRIQGQESRPLSGGFDHRGKTSQQIYTESRYKLDHYLSQFSLVDYDTQVKVGHNIPELVYDVPSLKVVEPMEPVEEGTTLGTTFIPVDPNITLKPIEEGTIYRIETMISLPPLFPTTPIKIAFFLRIKPN